MFSNIETSESFIKRQRNCFLISLLNVESQTKDKCHKILRNPNIIILYLNRPGNTRLDNIMEAFNDVIRQTKTSFLRSDFSLSLWTKCSSDFQLYCVKITILNSIVDFSLIYHRRIFHPDIQSYLSSPLIACQIMLRNPLFFGLSLSILGLLMPYPELASNSTIARSFNCQCFFFEILNTELFFFFSSFFIVSNCCQLRENTQKRNTKGI